MGIYFNDNRNQRVIEFCFGNRDAEIECFYCGKTIIKKRGFILWHKPGDTICFHRKCAIKFMAHLGSDIIRLKADRKKKHIV